jgi:hypothetical protein
MLTTLLGTVTGVKTGADARFIESILLGFSIVSVSIVHKVQSNGRN